MGERKTNLGAYPDDVRERALELIREHGTLTPAHEETGMSRAALSGMAREAGIDLHEEATRRTAAANSAAVARVAEAREELARNLEQQAVDASRALTAILATAADYATAVADGDADSIAAHRDPETGRWLVSMPPEAEAALASAAALAQHPISARDLATIQRSALDALADLEGRSSSSGTVVVQFNVPRPPVERPAPVVVEGGIVAG